MAQVTDFQDLRVYVPVQIANGTALSGVIDTGGMVLAGILMDVTGWTTASITFAVSDTLAFTNSYNLFSAAATELVIASITFGNPLAIDFAATSAGFVAGVANAFRPWRYIKIRSGTAATPVNQGAARNLQAICLPQS